MPNKRYDTNLSDAAWESSGGSGPGEPGDRAGVMLFPDISLSLEDDLYRV